MFGGRPDDFASQLGNDAGGLAPGHSAPGDGGLASLLSSFLRLFVDRATKKQQGLFSCTVTFQILLFYYF